MKPVFKPLGWFLLGGSLAAVSGAGAFGLPWKQEAPAAQVAPVAAAAAVVAAPAPAPVLTAGAVPNYRAIVQQSGPAVVGVRVEGVRKASAEDDEAAADDPAQRFFRSLPGYRGQMPQ